MITIAIVRQLNMSCLMQIAQSMAAICCSTLTAPVEQLAFQINKSMFKIPWVTVESRCNGTGILNQQVSRRNVIDCRLASSQLCHIASKF